MALVFNFIILVCLRKPSQKRLFTLLPLHHNRCSLFSFLYVNFRVESLSSTTQSCYCAIPYEYISILYEWIFVSFLSLLLFMSLTWKSCGLGTTSRPSGLIWTFSRFQFVGSHTLRVKRKICEFRIVIVKAYVVRIVFKTLKFEPFVLEVHPQEMGDMTEEQDRELHPGGAGLEREMILGWVTLPLSSYWTGSRSKSQRMMYWNRFWYDWIRALPQSCVIMPRKLSNDLNDKIEVQLFSNVFAIY